MKTTTPMIRAIIGALSLGAAACQIDRSTGTDPTSIDQGVRVPGQPVYGLDASGTCTFCLVEPVTFVRAAGAPRVETVNFSAIPGPFIVDLDDLGSRGAGADVTLNGVALLKPAAAENGSGQHYNATLALQSENTLEIRLVGKPGSKLRVAIWPVKPVTIDAVTLSPGTAIEIAGPYQAFQATVTNHTSRMLIGVSILTSVEQPGAIRWVSADGDLACGYGIGWGVLPPGVCVTLPQSNSIRVSNDPGEAGGQGTLVAGAANAVIHIGIGGWTELDSYVVPIVLLPPRPAWVYVAPLHATIAIGAQQQLTATVRAGDGTTIPEPVEWSSSSSAIATVTSSGLVTGVSPGTATITARTYGPMKTGTAQVTVVAP